MDNGDLCLPFKAGQEAESKSFAEGFRSAWFRCEIKEISSKKGVIGHRSQYFDYPDEKVRWAKLFQRPSCTNQVGLNNRLELMVRPRYPPCYHRNEKPDNHPESDVIVIANDFWKVGDLVDWWCDGCFWSGRISHILANDKVQIKLPDPPVGEGLSYEVLCKDLRPTLDWSLEKGWTVPLSGELGNGWYCARLKWKHEEDAQKIYLDTADKKKDVLKVTADSVTEARSFNDNNKNELSAFKKSSTRGSRYALAIDDDRVVAAWKCLISARGSSTLESSIMNLEEVSCRIRWLKGLLKFGFQWSDLMIPSWKFVETHDLRLRM